MGRPPDNPYQAWIDTYADEAFAEGVRKVFTISDQVAEAASPGTRDQMLRAFVRAAQLEWMFWDSRIGWSAGRRERIPARPALQRHWPVPAISAAER